MKNLSLVLNGVLLIAVAVLYYLHFRSTVPSAAAVNNQAGDEVPTAQGIVYINSDSLLEQFDFYTEQKVKFESEQSRVSNELKSESEKLQRDAATYQQQAIGMTELEREQKETELGRRQQQLMEKKDELLGRLDESQARSSEELYDKINSYLKEYNKNKNYQFVLGYQKGGGILFANENLNITSEIIEGLNNSYKQEKEK